MAEIALNHITRWAGEKDSQDGLPELVHRLIRETPGIRRLYLPTGDATRYRGWDGLATAVEGGGNIRLPAGESAWEMGVTADIKGKADEDYDKRSTAPLPDTTFVFVTPRQWPGGKAWADARRAEGLWRDVRVLDGGDLHQWLADSPRAALWFAAKHLGLAEAKADWSDPVIAWDDDALRVETGPLAWLTWTARLTPLLGREDEKRALLDWARTGGGVRFRFLVGEGGSGKTRLAHEVAFELAASDPLWAAGRVEADTPFPLDAGLRGCLLLVDYPEERRDAVRERLRQLAAAPGDPARPVRVLFLSRRGADLWQDVVDEARAVTRQDPDIPLPEGLPADDAWALFRAAVPRVPRAADGPPPALLDEAAFREWFARMPVNQRPLLVTAAAVETALNPDHPAVRLSADMVIDALARREAERLHNLTRLHGLPRRALSRLSALAAVRGSLDEPAIERLAAPALGLDVGPAPGLIDRLTDTGCLKAGALPAPQPDIVAAALLVRELSDRPAKAPEWLWTALDGREAEAIDRLGRLTWDAEVVLGLHKSGFTGWLAAMVQGRPDRCERLEPLLLEVTLPHGLLPLSAAVYRTQIEGAPDDEARARAASNLSVRLSALGDGPGALATIWDAVAIYRRLAAQTPARFEPDLALSLNNLSNRLSNAGEGAEALAASREAVELYRRLAAHSPARFEPVLAASLNNLSVQLSNPGERAKALAASREAVELYRRLAAHSPARFEPVLAASLNNLSLWLADAGEGAAALAAIWEAVELYRRLAAQAPARFESNLAASLNNLSVQLSNPGERAKALAASREAVAIRRRLAALAPARFEPVLAASLNNLSLRLSDAGEGAGALAAIRETVELYRRLAAQSPARFEPDLARSLYVLALRLDEAGAPDDALPCAEEAERLCAPYAAAVPGGPAGRLHRAILGELARLRAKAAGVAEG
ncbi:ATP-binding protein [Azospirillum oleiclasticum]|uniref:Tetratricopeptide repeat protein n=1 Tax=Azospirillum oleiclasticum TaxID=2735135 RepID=A0ABX2T881_9PROT|nr:ATP-binding protein [Azospirillum oleiclasticum]NYZ20488.1 tetratricopeptide repeat protein [Azospirillum oleiclasticum]